MLNLCVCEQNGIFAEMGPRFVRGHKHIKGCVWCLRKLKGNFIKALTLVGHFWIFCAHFGGKNRKEHQKVAWVLFWSSITAGSDRLDAVYFEFLVTLRIIDDMILHLHIVHMERNKRCLDSLLCMRIGVHSLFDQASKSVLGYGGSHLWELRLDVGDNRLSSIGDFFQKLIDVEDLVGDVESRIK